MTLEERLKKWTEITGINPQEDKGSYTIYLDGRLSDYDIKKMNDRIIEALKYDNTGIFTTAYLSIYLDQFLKNKKVTLIDMLNNQELYDYIEDIKILYNDVKEDKAEDKIKAEAKSAMSHYNRDCNLDTLSIMEIKSSAEYCVNNGLKLRQFSRGERWSSEFKLSRNIYMFDNLDSIIRACISENLNGIMLSYVKDSEELANSYFSFVIKNGDNMYILTDMPQRNIPVYISRCPGRDMSRRIEANYFPYSTVANIDTSDLWDNSRYGVSEIGNQIIEKGDAKLYTIIGTIDTLSEEEALWCILMADLIKKKFYETTLPELPISYTRCMIDSPLLEKSDTAIALRDLIPSISLDNVAIGDTDDLEYDRDNSKYIGLVKNIIDRYKDKVDPTLLNIIKNTDKAGFIEDTYATKNFWGEKTASPYVSLDIDNETGTEEEIKYKQKWIARRNFAVAVNNLNKDDYNENGIRLQECIGKLIAPRIREIVKEHLRGKYLGKAVKRHSFATSYTDESEPFSKTWEFNKYYNDWPGLGEYHYGDRWPNNKTDYRCAFTGKPAGVVVKVSPKNAEELALLCGVSVKDLPEELQFFDKKSHPYFGNSLLDNIDPCLSIIKDSFNDMSFETTIFLAKSEYLKLCVEAGVDPVEFWENEPPVCYKYNPTSNKPCSGSVRRVWNGSHYENVKTKKCLKCKWHKCE